MYVLIEVYQNETDNTPVKSIYKINNDINIMRELTRFALRSNAFVDKDENDFTVKLINHLDELYIHGIINNIDDEIADALVNNNVLEAKSLVEILDYYFAELKGGTHVSKA